MTDERELSRSHPSAGNALVLPLIAGIGVFGVLFLQCLTVCVDFVMPSILGPIFRAAAILIAISAAQLMTPSLNESRLRFEMWVSLSAALLGMVLGGFIFPTSLATTSVQLAVGAAAVVGAVVVCWVNHEASARLTFRRRLTLAMILAVIGIVLSTIVLSRFTVDVF